jgi:hypothetical protein
VPRDGTVLKPVDLQIQAEICEVPLSDRILKGCLPIKDYRFIKAMETEESMQSTQTKQLFRKPLHYQKQQGEV